MSDINNTEEFVLTDENYYSDEANDRYMSNSTFKKVYGHPAHPHPCEAAAIYSKTPETEALIVGSYVDSYFEGADAHAKWKEENAKKILQKTGNKPYKFITDADKAIARVVKDKVFMKFMSGETQRIMTGTISGQPFKIKMDSYHEDEMIVDLKYVKGVGNEYNEHLKRRLTFIEDYGYYIQAAIYQEIVYQNTGKRLPFFIAYITKEAIPDFDVVQLSQEKMDEALEFVKINLIAKPYAMIKANPKACGKRSCPYCRDLKVLTGPKTYEEFETIVAGS